MFRRMALLGGAVIAVLGFVASPAGAQDDPYTVSDATATPQPDGTVVLSGGGCPPDGEVTYVVRQGNPQQTGPVATQGSTTADADGEFETTTAPLDNGRYTAEITCGGDTAVLAFTVSRGRGVGGGQGGGQTGNQGQGVGASQLPRTGSDGSIPMARLGVILVASGGVALYAAKKRNGRRAAFLGD